MEEERRLCYVGVTRAKERLYLMRAFRRSMWGSSEPATPSRFLADIPRHLIVAAGHTVSRSGQPSMGWTPGSRRRPSARARASSDGATPDSPGAAPSGSHKAPAGVSAGDKVRHAMFGEGIVVSCKPSGDDVEVTVAFKEGLGVKRLLLGFAPLEKVE